MILWIADDRDAAAIPENSGPLRYRLHRIVGALAVHVGLQQEQQRIDGSLRKDDDVVDAAYGGNDLRSFVGAKDGPPRSFPAGRFIAVDGHDQAIGFTRGGLQIANVSDVHEIEAPVCKRHGAAGLALVVDERNQLLACDDPPHQLEDLR